MDKQQRFIATVQPPAHRSEPALWFAFQENKLLVFSEGTQVRLPYLVNVTEIGLNPLRQNYLGMLDGVHCYAAELDEEFSPLDGMVFEGLRQLYGRLDEDLFPLAGRALQIVDWDRTHQFCSRCGTRLETKSKERAKGCPQCGQLHFPRLAPAIIVLVERDRQVLLGPIPPFYPRRLQRPCRFRGPGGIAGRSPRPGSARRNRG